MRKRARRWAVQAATGFALAAAIPAYAQAPNTPPKPPQSAATGGSSAAVPSFWDPRRRPEKPDTTRVTLIRFVTEVDYPPFDYAGADGNPAGFNVDLARLICDELKIPCTMQMRRFDTMVDSLNDNRSDADSTALAGSGAVVQVWSGEALPGYWTASTGEIASAWRPVEIDVATGIVYAVEAWSVGTDPADPDAF